MDKLVEYVTNKIGYTIIAIAGILLPGNLFIFVFNQELYIKLDIIRLILLSLASMVAIFFPVFFLYIIIEALRDKYQHKEITRNELLIEPIVYTNVIMYLGMLGKIYSKSFSINKFLNYFCGIYILVVIISIITWGLFIIYIKVKEIESGK